MEKNFRKNLTADGQPNPWAIPLENETMIKINNEFELLANKTFAAPEINRPVEKRILVEILSERMPEMNLEMA